MEAMASCKSLTLLHAPRLLPIDANGGRSTPLYRENSSQRQILHCYGLQGLSVRQKFAATDFRKRRISISCASETPEGDSRVSEAQDDTKEPSPGGDGQSVGERVSDSGGKAESMPKASLNGKRSDIGGAGLKASSGWQSHGTGAPRDRFGGWGAPIELEKGKSDLTELAGLPEILASLVIAASIAAVGYAAYSRRGTQVHLYPDIPAVEKVLDLGSEAAVASDRQEAASRGSEQTREDHIEQQSKSEAENQEAEAAATRMNEDKEHGRTEERSAEMEAVYGDNEGAEELEKSELVDPTAGNGVKTEGGSLQHHDVPAEDVQQNEDFKLSPIVEEISEDSVSMEEIVVVQVSAEQPHSQDLVSAEAETQQRLTRKVSPPAPISGGVNLGKGILPKVVVPAMVDPVQAQALEALQALKVVEADVDPAGICTRREYARWVVTASTVLSRHAGDRVFPSMFVEGITELAFDDVLPEDPDFPAIQGLAEAGLVSSKLSRKDIGCEINPIQPGCSGDTSTFFHPDSPLTRQDLISWKVSLEHHKLAPTSVDDLKKVSNFIDIKRIDKDALPAVAYDLSLGEKSLITATFGFTRRFEPMKPVTRAQVACTLALGESAELVGEELERINYERMAEEAVQAADEAEAEEARAEQEAVDAAKRDLAVERQRREDAEKAVEAVRQELRMAEEQRQEEKESIIKTKGVVETERGLLEDLKRSTEEQMALLSSSKQGLQAEKKLLQELRAMAEAEREATIRVKAEMAAEKEALLTARARAEDESRKAMDEAKKLQAVRRELGANSESLPGTLEKLSAGEVRPLPKWPNVPSDEPESATEGQAGPLFNAENLLNRGKELRTRAGAAVEGAVATTTEMVSSAVKGVGEVTGGAQEKAGHAASAVADGVKKAAQDVKEEAVKFAQWLKLS